MFIKRYYITEGATTTAGGTVRASIKSASINGASMVLEGDPVDCPACGAQGVVQCVMPRLVDRFGDKEYALGDDLCICGCNPAPKLVANQNFKCQALLCVDEDPADEAVLRRGGSAARTDARHTESAADLRPLRLVMRGTGKPHANRPYRLDLKDGKVVQGSTDANGVTRPLTPDERTALRTWKTGQR